MTKLISYDSAMIDANAILTLRIDTTEPIEIGAFVGAFTSLAEEYRREIRSNHPNADGDARIYVKEVRKGSIEADLVPYIMAAAPLVAQMDQVMVVDQFVRTWGKRISALVQGNLLDWNPTKSEIKTLADATVAIATDPNASSTLEAVTFEDGKRLVRASFKFTTPEARDAQKTIDTAYRQLEKPDDADHKRVLMLFKRTDVGNAQVGKRSGEKVLIEEIHSRPLALMYASELAEERLKHEIRDTEDNVYKKGFVVDVNVRLVNGRPSVYAVTNVHEVIDLPDDE